MTKDRLIACVLLMVSNSDFLHVLLQSDTLFTENMFFF
jgi:hypothetical protein